MAKEATHTPLHGAKPVPTIHLVMIQVATLIAVLSGTGYAFAPPAKADFFKEVALLAVAFLFGKFTNGFSGGREKAKEEQS